MLNLCTTGFLCSCTLILLSSLSFCTPVSYHLFMMAAWQTPINQLQGSAAGAPWPGTVPYWAPLPQCYGPMPPPPPFYGQPPMLPLPPSPLAYNHQSSALSPQQMELSGLSGEVKELESAIEMKQRDMKALLADTEQFGNPSPTTVSTADLELSVHVEQNSSPD